MIDNLDAADSLIDVVVLCTGLVLIALVVFRSSPWKSVLAQPPGVVFGGLAWLAIFGFALYLIFG